MSSMLNQNKISCVAPGVLYGLKDQHYAGFARHQLPHAHEFFVPMKTLTAENSEDNPRLRALLERASLSSNFYNMAD